MRLMLVSLLALGLAAPALAQTIPAASPPPAAAASAPAPQAPAATPAPSAAPSPAPAAGEVPPPTATAPAAIPPAEAAPTPPAPPTDPAAISLLTTLETVCIPAANGGDLAKLAKTASYRKSGDSFVLKQAGFQFTILSQGSNPTQCHVNLIHSADPEGPARPLVVALHNWAAVSRGWDLYRNDKSITGAQQFTTRSWEHDGDGKHEALVLTTIRKSDGTPSRGAVDTSEMIYSVSKTAG